MADKTSEKSPEVKYPEPKILLMNIDSSVGEHLRAKGFNIDAGSFGNRYRVSETSSRRLYEVRGNAEIPKYYAEKQIVVIDLNSEITDEPQNNIFLDGEGNPFMMTSRLGIIDPRPINMSLLQNDFDRIYQNKGIFIIFASTTTAINGENFNNNINIYDIKYHTWSFLSIFNPYFAKEQIGAEIVLSLQDGIMGNFLLKYLPSSEYLCKFELHSYLIEKFLLFAKNKFDDIVSGVIEPKDGNDKSGLIFLFPQIKNKAEFLAEFLSDVLPQITPNLFPHHEGKKWVYHPEYELEPVLKRKAEIQQIQSQAESRIAQLEAEIEKERQQHQYMYDLLTETGDNLVSAVKQTLEILGFKGVVDADEQIANENKSKNKDEDLQITLEDGTLILTEVKGLTGKSSDGDVLQVSKHLVPRMRQLNKTNIRGLFIVNHQRNLRPSDRISGKDNLFNQSVLETSETVGFGLMTTWNLYKILRNFQKLGWIYEQVKPLFIQNGFIEPIPVHYQYIGTIDEYWKKNNAIGVNLAESVELHKGDKIAYEFDIEFEEQVVESLQIDKTSVEIARAGQLAGIEIGISTEKVKKGLRMYRVLG